MTNERDEQLPDLAIDITPEKVQFIVTPPPQTACVVVPGQAQNRAYRRAEAADKRKSNRNPSKITRPE